MLKGVDMSAYQTDVNYKSLREDGVAFAIIRAGYGKLASQKDARFDVHYNGCKSAGIDVGAYWYSYAMNEDEARQEAKACIEVLKKTQCEYPIYYDVEEKKQYNLGKAKVTAIIKAFCDEMEKAGYWVGIYTNTSWYNTVIDSSIKNRYALWIAHWNVSKPGITDEYGIWQYKVGKQVGVAGDCDLDYGYTSYPNLIKIAGKNNWPKYVPYKKTIDVTLTINDVTYSGTLTEEK